MEATVGAVAVGLGVVGIVLVGPRVISGVASAAGPLTDEAVKVGDAVYEAVTGALSAANEQLIALVALVAGESKEEAERQVEKAEDLVEEVVEDVTKEEVESFVTTLVLAAI